MESKVPEVLKTGQDLSAALAVALREQADWFNNLRRYSTTAQREFFKATRQLAMIRKPIRTAAKRFSQVSWSPPEMHANPCQTKKHSPFSID